jgi:Kef-type K+ transport system membrane component KefB
MTSAHQTEATLLIIVLQLSVIIGIARIAGNLSRRLGHPMVVGEILAGLLLGPSFLGRLLPNVSHALFPGSVSQTINIVSQVGLIFLMFLIGLEFDFGHIRTHGKAAGLVALTGIAVPFTLGLLVGRWMAPSFPAYNANGFALFLATALSITAIPVLGRVMLEFNIHRTELGVLTITAAAMDDALGWMLVAIVAAVVGAQFEPMATLRMIGLTVLFGIVMALVVRPLMVRWIQRSMSRRAGAGGLSLDALAITLVVMFLCAAATNLIGIFSIFGAFALGAVLYDQEQFREAVFQRLKDFVTTFFLPVFFTFTGLHTDMGSLGTATLWLFLGVVLLAAVAGKFIGCCAAARLSGLPPRQSACVGIMMNARGLMGLIAANVGLQMGAVPKEAYCMLVVMCVVSTVMLSPILRRLMVGTELHAPFQQSEFAQEHEQRQNRRMAPTEAAGS